MSGCRDREPAATLPPCVSLDSLAPILVVLVGACGSDEETGPAVGDYFAQLQRVSETGRIQQRGLQRDLRIRLEEALPGEDRMTVLTVYVDQSARLYQDVVDALDELDLLRSWPAPKPRTSRRGAANSTWPSASATRASPVRRRSSRLSSRRSRTRPPRRRPGAKSSSPR